MIGFLPFASAENALENMNSITEHEVTDDLRVSVHIVIYLFNLTCVIVFSGVKFAQRKESQASTRSGTDLMI